MENQIPVIENSTQEKKIDANLDALIQEISKGNVVPIVGTDMMKLNIDDKEFGLIEFLLKRLEEKYEILRDSKFNYDASDCLSAPEKLNYIHSIVTREKLGFYTYIKEIMKDIEPLYNTISLDKITKIRKFKLFINASFTNILEKSVEKNRAFISSAWDVFSLNIFDSPLQDIEIESALNSISPADSPKKLKKTIVYNLYGKYEWGANSIVVDDDILELVHTVSTNRDKLKTLYELLSASSLLFIGCNFPDWLLRFFIRIFSKQKLSVNSSLYSVADILNSKIDRTRAIFISNSSIKYFEFDGNAFIERLFNKILKSEPTWIRNTKESNYLFLSYATENQSKVIDIYEKLDENNFDVFMDIRKIDFGNDITEDIKEAINNCKIFIPIISKETDSNLNQGRFFKKEWDHVLKIHFENNPKNENGKYPIILPIFLNAIKEDELGEKETTPKKFFELKYQGANAENGLSIGFMNRIKELLK